MRNRIRLFVVLLYVVNLSSICLLAQTAGAKAHSVPKPVKARPQFAGIWNGAFGSNLGSQTIVFMMQQIGTTLTGTYQTGEGLQGVLWGSVQKDGHAQLSAEQKSVGPSATFTIDAVAKGDHLEFTYQGRSEGRLEKGQGKATRASERRGGERSE